MPMQGVGQGVAGGDPLLIADGAQEFIFPVRGHVGADAAIVPFCD